MRMPWLSFCREQEFGHTSSNLRVFGCVSFGAGSNVTRMPTLATLDMEGRISGVKALSCSWRMSARRLVAKIYAD